MSSTEYDDEPDFKCMYRVVDPTESQRELFTKEIMFDGRRRPVYDVEVVYEVLALFESAFGPLFDRHDYRREIQLTDGICIMGKKHGPFGAEHFAIVQDKEVAGGFKAYYVTTHGGWGATIYGRKSWEEAMKEIKESSADIYCHDDYESEGYNSEGCEHCTCGCRYCAYKRDWSEDENCTGCFHGCRHCWDECPDE
jgi:hypothetical protein